jgi:hypothetical protein
LWTNSEIFETLQLQLISKAVIVSYPERGILGDSCRLGAFWDALGNEGARTNPIFLTPTLFRFEGAGLYHKYQMHCASSAGRG